MIPRSSTTRNNCYSTTYARDFKYYQLSQIQKVTPSVARYSTSTYPSGHSEERKSLKSAHGLVGLRNLGNTCFMNCILQCLSNNECLRDYCMDDSYQADLCRASGGLMEEFAKLIQAMWSSYGREAISAFKFKTQIDRCAPVFAGFKQQDAHELLHYLLDGLHKEVRVAAGPRGGPEEAFNGHLPDEEKGAVVWRNYLDRENSKIVELFGGLLKSTVTCHHCGFCSTVFDPFWTLSLPILKTPVTNIMDCMRLFTKEDILDGLERVTCCQCKVKRQCSKKFTIQKFPKILVLHLKRFSQAPRAKLFTNVTFPMTNLNLKPFAASENANAVYNLYAVTNHSGTSTKTGHYTAHCRSPLSGEWYSFDDSRVTPICSSKVRTDNAYILFYELAS